MNALIVQARNDNAANVLALRASHELHPVMHEQLSRLTSELVAHRESSLSLICFLDESRSLYARLRQIAYELQATDAQQFKEAVWKDSLVIMLVLYEILTSKVDLEDVMKLRGTKAQFMLDLMQDTMRAHIDLMDLRRGGSPRIRGARRTFLNNIINAGLLQNVDRPLAQLDVLRLIVQLSEASDLLPSSLTIHGVQHTSSMPVAGGSFGDIYTAQYQGDPVGLKRLRLFQADSDESLQKRRKFCREALIWKNLEHEYVLPFLGVDSETFPGFLCLVSPWMSQGALVNSKGGPPEDSIPVLIYEIAVGLQYLHSQNIVHGDLRGANILLDDEGHARLADFGLAVVTDGPLAPTNRGGSTRWMAPELLDPSCCRLDRFQRTPASDIYSFACVCLELYTGKPPLSEYTSDATVLLYVITGGRPECPSTTPMWCQELIGKCLSYRPSNRPGIETIIESVVKSLRKRPRGESFVESALDKKLRASPKSPASSTSSDSKPEPSSSSSKVQEPAKPSKKDTPKRKFTEVAKKAGPKRSTAQNGGKKSAADRREQPKQRGKGKAKSTKRNG
ncbi:Protein kinase domain-containing protein [Mycena venus]|uniref:Protein kinase domain-containing protein n=1 Tax=Mycena venus TaxID=2733690 RepID=A0A8H6Z1E8_9AGAR|nr:Protein kinase domain-containing protein [Mycena venus]